MMGNIAALHKIPWALPAVVALVLAVALGCGSSTEPAQSSAQESATQSLPQLGNRVGDRIIPFTLRLADGTIVTSAELLSQNRATFLLFFKVNWSTCAIEMRWMKEIHPDYADKVAVYVVSYDTFQDVVKEQEHLREQGLTWPVAFPVGTMLRDYRIVITSTKIAFDSRGVITYRAGFGEGTEEAFRRVFQKLAASR